MDKTYNQGKDEIAKLCKYFSTNKKSFLAAGIKEAHIRQSLIDPFFEALGSVSYTHLTLPTIYSV